MNYSPGFDRADKGGKADRAKAEPPKASKVGVDDRSVSGGKEESAWDAFKKDLDNVFNP